jgi:energy-coupling factor transport system ATP-binding protein
MLELSGYSYSHSGNTAATLNNINLFLGAGKACMLTGRSGSGKSTLLAAVSGLIPHYYGGTATGSVRVNGIVPADTDLGKMGAHAGLMLQNAEVQFLAPTVEEEIFLCLRCRDVEEASCSALVSAQLEKFGITDIKSASVLDLSEGQKQKTVLASLTALRPPLLLLDEPTANLDPRDIMNLKDILTDLKKEGMSLLIADHRLSWARDLCESFVLLENGYILRSGDFSELEEIHAELCLRSPMPQEEKPLKEGGDGVRVRELSFGYGKDEIIKNLSCNIPFGKVTALSGPSGTGKTTFAKLLAGLLTPRCGDITFGGLPVKKPAEHTCVVLQNSDHQLYMDSVIAEICLAANMNPKNGREAAVSLLKDFGLNNLENRHPQSLSGGEKQRLSVAAGVATPADLVILDEPTSGLDGLNLRLMAAHIRRMAENGAAVLVITHDIELINLCADYKIQLRENEK